MKMNEEPRANVKKAEVKWVEASNRIVTGGRFKQYRLVKII